MSIAKVNKTDNRRFYSVSRASKCSTLKCFFSKNTYAIPKCPAPRKCRPGPSGNAPDLPEEIAGIAKSALHHTADFPEASKYFGWSCPRQIQLEEIRRANMTIWRGLVLLLICEMVSLIPPRTTAKLLWVVRCNIQDSLQLFRQFQTSPIA